MVLLLTAAVLFLHSAEGVAPSARGHKDLERPNTNKIRREPFVALDVTAAGVLVEDLKVEAADLKARQAEIHEVTARDAEKVKSKVKATQTPSPPVALPSSPATAPVVTSPDPVPIDSVPMTAAKVPVGGAANSTATSSIGANRTAANDMEGDDEASKYSVALLIRVLGFLLVLEIIGALTVEFSMASWHNAVQSGNLSDVPQQAGLPWSRLHVALPILLAPYFSSEHGFIGRMCCVAVLMLGLNGLFFAWVENIWQKHWWDLFNARDSAQFPKLMGFYILIVAAWMLNNVYRSYMQSWLYIDWRTYMTHRIMSKWLRGHTHYLMQLRAADAADAAQSSTPADEIVRQIDNPDQRIQEDIALFVSTMTSIVPSFLASFGALCVFAPIVAHMEPRHAFGIFELPGWLIYLTALYSLGGAFATQYIAYNLSRLNYATQMYEAEFRHQALHVRDNSASIALYNSEGTEESRMRAHFENVSNVKWRSTLLSKRLGFFTNAYGFAQALIPYFILAPSYFKGDISLGSLFQLVSAMHRCSDSFDWFLSSYESLAALRATADRLLAFELAIDSVKEEADKLEKGPGGWPPSKPQVAKDPDANPEEDRGGDSEDGTLVASIGQVRLPCGQMLWRDVRFQVPKGHRLLISGPEGTGKSVLFKALAGIWPHVSDRDVHLPAQSSDEVLFVPQRPALPKRCSLGDAVCYPEKRSTYSDAQILQVLQTISLEELGFAPPEEPSAVDPEAAEKPAASAAAALPASGGKLSKEALDYVDSWGSRLSPGQQQRLAIGHILLKRPRILFLDEATSNVSKAAAQELYQMILSAVPPDGIVVSISHDVAALSDFHQLHLEAHGEGSDKTLKLFGGKNK